MRKLSRKLPKVTKVGERREIQELMSNTMSNPVNEQLTKKSLSSKISFFP